VNSQIADGSDLGTCRPQVTSVGDLPTSSVSAAQLIPEKACSEKTPPLAELQLARARILKICTIV